MSHGLAAALQSTRAAGPSNRATALLLTPVTAHTTHPFSDAASYPTEPASSPATPAFHSAAPSTPASGQRSVSSQPSLFLARLVTPSHELEGLPGTLTPSGTNSSVDEGNPSPQHSPQNFQAEAWEEDGRAESGEPTAQPLTDQLPTLPRIPENGIPTASTPPTPTPAPPQGTPTLSLTPTPTFAPSAIMSFTPETALSSKQSSTEVTPFVTPTSLGGHSGDTTVTPSPSSTRGDTSGTSLVNTRDTEPSSTPPTSSSGPDLSATPASGTTHMPGTPWSAMQLGSSTGSTSGEVGQTAKQLSGLQAMMQTLMQKVLSG